MSKLGNWFTHFLVYALALKSKTHLAASSPRSEGF